MRFAHFIHGILHKVLQDGSQASSSTVALASSYGHFLQCFWRDHELSVGGTEQLLVLLAKRILRPCQYGF